MRLERVSREYLRGLPSLPGIDAEEEFVIRDWLTLAGDVVESFSIDVRAPIPPRHYPRGDPRNLERMWFAITSPRIDMIAWFPGAAYVVEVKRIARFPAVTQVEKYTDAMRTRMPDHIFAPLLLCREAVPGVAGRMQQIGGLLVPVPVCGIGYGRG